MPKDIQSQVNMFDELPEELKLETAQNQTNSELVNLFTTSKYRFALNPWLMFASYCATSCLVSMIQLN